MKHSLLIMAVIFALAGLYTGWIGQFEMTFIYTVACAFSLVFWFRTP